MTNSNPSPYQVPENQGQPQQPPFVPVPDGFQTPPPYQQNPYQNTGNPFATGNPYQQQNPYQNAPQPSNEYNLPAELNPRDKEEYFRMWRDFSWIPRPAVIWWGGLLAIVIIDSLFSWNRGLYSAVNSITSTAWLVFGIVGTVSFKQGVKQIFAFYPHLATSEKKMIEMRKIARLRAGYTYKDTFAHMWNNVKNLLTDIFSSSSSSSANAPAQNGNAPYSGPVNPASVNTHEGNGTPTTSYGNQSNGYSAPENGIRRENTEN
jgi:hypothetical protein